MSDIQDEQTYSDQFSFYSFRGMFLLLFVGLVLACLTACGEIFWIWWKKKNNSEVEVTFITTLSFTLSIIRPEYIMYISAERFSTAKYI